MEMPENDMASRPPNGEDAPRRRWGRVVCDVLPILLVLGVALFARLWHIADFPANLSCDEGDNLREIYQIIERGKPPLFGLDWKPQPAMSQHMAAGAVRVLGDPSGRYLERFESAKTPEARRVVLDEWRGDLSDFDDVFALRFNSAVLSVLAIALFYLLARRTVSGPAALVAMFLLAVNPAFLNFSRSGWENVHIALAMFLAVWGVSRLVERRGPWPVNVLAAAVGAAWGSTGISPGARCRWCWPGAC